MGWKSYSHYIIVLIIIFHMIPLEIYRVVLVIDQISLTERKLQLNHNTCLVQQEHLETLRKKCDSLVGGTMVVKWHHGGTFFLVAPFIREF